MKSSSRNSAKVRLVAVHTTEGILKARDLTAFFNRADATGSSHASADSTGLLLGPSDGYVPYDRAAWTLRNGNPVSDNLEYCGWARYTRQQWLTAEAKGLEAIAQWVASRCKARGIPPVKLSPAEVRAGKSGVIGHVDWTQGMNDGTHWDPGPDFPWDVVMARVKQINAPVVAPAKTANTVTLEELVTMDLNDKIESRLPVDIDPKTGRGKDVTVREILQNIQVNADTAARQLTAIYDYRNHHGNPIDDVVGHVMTVLKKQDEK